MLSESEFGSPLFYLRRGPPSLFLQSVKTAHPGFKGSGVMKLCAAKFVRDDLPRAEACSKMEVGQMSRPSQPEESTTPQAQAAKPAEDHLHGNKR